VNLVELLLGAAATSPRSIAVDVVDGPTLTYADLLDAVRRMASGLRARGVTPGERVAVLGRSGADLVTTLHAVSWVGAVGVPIDVRLAPAEVAGVLDDCQPLLVVADDATAGLATDAVRSCAVAPTLVDVRELQAAQGDDAPSTAADEALALILYTSGTTGSPKGVCLSHRAVVWNAVTICLGQRLLHGDAFLALTPLSHAGSGTRLFTSLVGAQRLVVAPGFDAERFPRIVEEHDVTTTILVPTMMADLLVVHPAERFARLRSVVYGAAPSALPVIGEALERWDCGLFHAYGLSEATTNVALLPPEEHTPDSLGSVGWPLPGVLVSVRDGDTDTDTDTDTGDVGEVCVRSDKVMSGYWNRPDETAAALRGGWLHTGDLGRLDERGRLWLVGRKKELIIVGGNNVYPAEIEAVLQQHPGVAEAAVVAGPHPRMGEVPVAFVVPVPGQTLVVDDVVAFAADRLAPFKVPRTIHATESLPRTGTGKVAKALLTERLASCS
jgi:fatty-acyl-CoA synthase